MSISVSNVLYCAVINHWSEMLLENVEGGKIVDNTSQRQDTQLMPIRMKSEKNFFLNFIRTKSHQNKINPEPNSNPSINLSP